MTYSISDIAHKSDIFNPTSPAPSRKRGSFPPQSPSAVGSLEGANFSTWGPGPFFTVPVYPQQLAAMQNNLSTLQTEVSALKKKLVQSSQTRGSLGLGPQFLAACLVAATILAVAVIVLVSLGLGGVLPFVLVCLAGSTNAIWAIVSASITTLICCVSIACIFLAKCDKGSDPQTLYVS